MNIYSISDPLSSSSHLEGYTSISEAFRRGLAIGKSTIMISKKSLKIALQSLVYFPYCNVSHPWSSMLLFFPRFGQGRHASIPPCHQRWKDPVVEESNVIPAKTLERSHSVRVLLFGSLRSQLQTGTDTITSNMRIGTYNMQCRHLLIVNLRSAFNSVWMIIRGGICTKDYTRWNREASKITSKISSWRRQNTTTSNEHNTL